MAETTHTPGPWTVIRSKMATDGAFDYAIGTDGSPVIAEAFGRDAKGGWPNAEANARLIAAAPEMLAALQEAEGELYQVPPADAEQERVLAVVRAAIAKATGRSTLTGGSDA